LQHENDVSSQNIDLPIAARRSLCPHQLPKCFHDVLPEPPPSLVLEASFPDHALGLDLQDVPTPSSSVSQQDPQPLNNHLFSLISTPKNVFGLIHRFFATRLPCHDPDDLDSMNDLSDISVSTTNNTAVSRHQDTPHSLLYPYPNENSFRLGHWYWNGGVQKSKESFRELLDIVSNPGFKSSDVRHTKWDKINEILANNEHEDAPGTYLDPGWSKTPVKIAVPFHQRLPDPGSCEYIGADLFHRSLLDIIKEKLTTSQDLARFHFDPYELLWKRTDDYEPVRVHGELYTSQAFINAHRQLQQSPGEPGCNLPQVIVALMLWSDSTQLTSFGDAKLWPLYLFFGNESKYQCCKPSCNLCCHAAYFQNVRLIVLLLLMS